MRIGIGNAPQVSARPAPRKRCCARCTRLPFSMECGKPGCKCHDRKDAA